MSSLDHHKRRSPPRAELHALSDDMCVNGVTVPLSTLIVSSTEPLPVPVQALVSFSAFGFAVRPCGIANLTRFIAANR
jgi:hypothetical protein